MDLSAELTRTLGDAFTVERELGGGGMGRVFLVRDQALRRDLVVKVFSRDVAADIDAARFRQEILIAAGLQHPHIVPVLTSGEVAGSPFYTMRFIAGDSLRARLKRDGAVPVATCVRILRDVAQALAHAHAQGIVHRDIKPDNILLSDDIALVTDFGIAKALTDARVADGTPRLTESGIGVGTSAYAAPEQATGDATTDHRADLYALGIVAYELLSGETPFRHQTAAAYFLAHLLEEPPPITERRPDVPATLAALIHQCLAKQPGDRPESAERVIETLDAISSGRDVVAAADARVSQLKKALFLYAGASLAVAGLAWGALQLLEVPDWVLPGALVVMALGLPVILVAPRAQRRPGRTARLFTWRRVALGGVAALGLFLLGVGGAVAARAADVRAIGGRLGVGPGGAKPLVLVTDFSAVGEDTALAIGASEAMRISLSQSKVAAVMPPALIAEVLGRMQRDRLTRVDLALAHDVAAREGVGLIVDGSVARLERGYLLTVRLVDADSGRVLRQFTSVATSEEEIIPAMDRLAGSVRAATGESLRGLRVREPLSRVSTASLHALQLFEQGQRANDLEQDFPKAVRLLLEAVREDSAFATAWRKLSVALSNADASTHASSPITQRAATERAYLFRDQATPRERADIELRYLGLNRSVSRAAFLRAHREVFELSDSTDQAVNFSDLLNAYGEHEEAVLVCAALIRRVGRAPLCSSNMIQALASLGRLDEADSVLAEMRRQFPTNQRVVIHGLIVLYLRGDLGRFRAALDSVRRIDHPAIRGDLEEFEIFLMLLTGQLTDGARLLERRLAATTQGNRHVVAIEIAGGLSAVDTWARLDPEGAARRMDRALAEHPFDSISGTDPPFGVPIYTYAHVGRASEARRYLALRLEAVPDTVPDDRRHEWWQDQEAAVAIAEGRTDEAVRILKGIGRLPGCADCVPWRLGMAFEKAGAADSAIVWYEAALRSGANYRATRWFNDGITLPFVLERLSILHEQRGDHAKSAEYASRLLALWTDPEPELMPRVRAARARVARARGPAPELPLGRSVPPQD